MFYAVYTNGAVDMKPTFELLHHSSEDILFFAECSTDSSCRYYRFLNSHGLGIASYSYLFFIGRLLDRTPYQPIIIGIEVDIPYRRSAIPVKLHISRYRFKYFFLLFERQHIFQLIPLEHRLKRHPKSSFSHFIRGLYHGSLKTG